MAFDARFFDPSQFDTGEITIEGTKAEIVEYLRDELYPRQTSGTIEVSLSISAINYEVAQYFIPYQTLYKGRDSKNTFTTYIKLKKYGTPDDGLSIYLQTDNDYTPDSTLASSSISVGSVSTSGGIISFNFVLTNPRLISKNKYWIKVVPNNTASTINYFSIYKSITDEDYLLGSYYKRESGSTWSPQLTDLYFQVDPPLNWIGKTYPANTLDITSFPRIIVDVIDRPVVDEAYIDYRLFKQQMNIAISVYSRYPNELDDLCSYIDKAMNRNRINFSSAYEVTPSRISPISLVREDIFVRSLFFIFKQRVYVSQ